MISFESYPPLLVQTSSYFACLSTSLIAVPNSFSSSGSGSGSGSGSAVEQGMELPLSGQDTLQLQRDVALYHLHYYIIPTLLTLGADAQ